MIVKLLWPKRRKPGLHHLRRDVLTLSRYVLDASPWADADRSQIRSLTAYALHAEREGVERGGKVGHAGTRNLLTSRFEDQQMEMLAVAGLSARVEKPLAHVIVSWQAGEEPTSEQLDEAVDIILRTAGLDRCLVIYAEHANTRNRHLHLAIVRVDPATGLAAATGLVIEDLHQGVALVEESQGWASEPGARYRARGGAVFEADTGKLVRDTDGVLRRSRSNSERTTGQRSVSAVAVDVQNAVIAAARGASSWAELHRALNEIGLSYRAAGSGGRVRGPNMDVKASELDRELARSKLEKRWGPFVDGPVHDEVDALHRYNRLVAEQRKRLRAERDRAIAQIKNERSATRRSVVPYQRFLVAPEICAEFDDGLRAINEAFKAAIKRCSRQRFSDVAAWRKAGTPTKPTFIAPPLMLMSDAAVAAEAWEPINGFAQRGDGSAVHYDDDTGRPLFSDHRAFIVVHDFTRADALDAALRLAGERWGRVQVKGSPEFVRACVARARALGIYLSDENGRVLAAPVAASPLHSKAQVATERSIDVLPSVADLEIERFTTELDKYPHLPLIRLKAINGGGESFTLEKDPNYIPAHVAIGLRRVEHDPRIQSYFAERRRESFNQAAVAIEAMHLVRDRDTIVTAFTDSGGLSRTVFLSFGDPDFVSVLDNVYARLARYPSSQQVRTAETQMSGDEVKIEEQQSAESADYHISDKVLFDAFTHKKSTQRN